VSKTVDKFQLINFFGILAMMLMSCLLVSCANMPGRSDLYLPGNKPVALILAHGRGKYPDWLVVNPLRHAVQKQLGFHSLSLQLPNGDIGWREYADEFPDAYQRIEQGVARLQQLGVRKIYLMGHSMGARMASAFIANHPNSPIDGLIVAGCRNNGGAPLDCKLNLQTISIPVLDIWGTSSVADVKAGAERNELRSDNYQQVAIEGADHVFDGKEDEMLKAMLQWLGSRQ